jgi:hypothetical protein
MSGLLLSMAIASFPLTQSMLFRTEQFILAKVYIFCRLSVKLTIRNFSFQSCAINPEFLYLICQTPDEFRGIL